MRKFPILMLLLCTSAVLADDGCPSLYLGASELETILVESLGPLKGLAARHDVTITPDDSACYVHIHLETRPVLVLPACAIDACSVAAIDGQRIALREFDMRGCDAVFNSGLSRHVKTAWSDAHDRIRAHCGSEGFDFSAVAPVLHDGLPTVRIDLRPARPAS